MLCYLYNDMAYMYVMSDYSYTFNVMLLVQIYGVRDVRHVRTSGDGTLDMRTRIRPADWCVAAEDCWRLKGESGWTGSSP